MSAAAPWQALLDQSIHSFNRGEMQEGRDACEQLMSLAELPDDVRELTRRNQTFYSQLLPDLVPGTRILPFEVPVDVGWSRFNPSIAADGDGFRAIVRSANMWLEFGQPRVLEFGQPLRSDTYLVDLDRDLAIGRVARLVDETAPAPADRTGPEHGFIDGRLFARDGRWQALASVRDRNPDGRAQHVLVAIAGDAFRDARLLHAPATSQDVGHGWVPALLAGDPDLFVVSGISPTVVLRVDDATGGTVEVARHEAPIVARSYRGGSPLLAVDGGYLALVHEVIPFEQSSETVHFRVGTRHAHRHRWVLFDRDLRLVQLSPPFSFLYPGIELAIGLARRGDDLIASFGVFDREAYLAVVPLAGVLARLAPPLAAALPRPAPAPAAPEPDAEPEPPPRTAAPPMQRLPSRADLRRAARAAPVADGAGPRSIGHRRLLVRRRGPRPIVVELPPGPPWLVSTTLTGNSRDSIGDALRSVVDWVDACLVIDTGITDDTLEVARSVVGTKLVVRSFPWVNDYAAARNFALAAAADLGAEWAITVDTDERIWIDGVDLRHHLATTRDHVYTVMHGSGEYAKERIFRLPARGEWRGPTHEAFYVDGPASVFLPDVVAAELAKSTERLTQKFERDAAVLTAYIADHPDEPRWLYYLGDALQWLGRHREAIAAFEACIALKGWDEEGAWACFRSADSMVALGEYDAAVERCAEGLAIHAGLGDLAWMAAFACWKAGRHRDAANWARTSIAMGIFAGFGGSIRRLYFRFLPGLYEAPYDVLRHALRALGDEAGAAAVDGQYEAALAARQASVAL